MMHDRRAGAQRHVLSAGVDEVEVFAPRRGQRAVPDHPVLRMKNDLFVATIEIRTQCRDADAEIDAPAVGELHRPPVAHLLAGQPFCPFAHLLILAAVTGLEDTKDWPERED